MISRAEAQTETPKVSLSGMQLRRVLHLLGLRLNGPLPVKETKVNLRKEFGFKIHPGLNENHPIDIPSNASPPKVEAKRAEILSTIDREFKEGNFIHIRIVGEKQLGSGNPVIILGRNSDRESGKPFDRSPKDTLENRLILGKKDQLLGFNIEGEVVELDAGMHVDIFSQPVSALAVMNGFDDKKTDVEDEKPEPREVRLGGGFRMEFKGVDDRYKPPRFIFKIIMLFEDNSPRRTAMNFREEWDIPQKEMSVALEFNPLEKNFIFPEPMYEKKNQSLTEAIESEEIENVGLLIFRNLIEKDNESIAKWLEVVTLVDPKAEAHSIEGVFSIRANGDHFELSGPKIISWDGSETSDEWADLLSKIDDDEVRYLAQKHFQQIKMWQLLIQTGFLYRSSIPTEKQPAELSNEENKAGFLCNSLLKLLCKNLAFIFKKIAACKTQEDLDAEIEKQRVAELEENSELQMRAYKMLIDAGLMQSMLYKKESDKKKLLGLLAAKQKLDEEQKGIVIGTNNMLEEVSLPPEIKAIIVDHIRPGYISTFSRERTGTRFLGNFLKTLYRGNPSRNGEEWQSIYNSQKTLTYHGIGNRNESSIECDVWQAEAKGNKFILVSINGYALGFWIQNNELVEIEDVKKLKEKRKELSQLLEVPIVEAMFGYLEEGG